MSLIDDAVSTAVHRIMELDGLDDLSASGVEAVIHNHLLEQLTADGPVILLPDEGEGVRVARLSALFRRRFARTVKSAQVVDSLSEREVAVIVNYAREVAK